MSDNTENNGGGGDGCLTFLLMAGAAIFVLMMMGGGDTATTTTTDTRSGVLSGNQTELLSRNQLNVLSDVWNCFGDNSCIITTEMLTTTTTNAPVNVDGERNTIIMADGRTACEDPNFPGQYAPDYCSGNWGQP